MATIADLRRMIEQESIEPENGNVVSEGALFNIPSKSEEPYTVHHGLDLIRANLCDKLWGSFNLQLIQFIEAQNLSEEELQKLAETVQLDDKHWDWLTKTCLHKSDEYNWFFLDIDGKPQAACLIYHPKASAIDSGDIFYIEYVAVAPWNRNNPMSEKQYAGAGTEIIKCAINYAIERLGLRYGFSLHSLPKAQGFYEKIGMTYFSDHNKDSMNYYEMSEENAKKYMEAS